MSTAASDLEQFSQFVVAQLAQGGNLSPEDCLYMWRANHPSPEELAESVAAINEGLQQAARREGTPVDVFFRELRAKKEISDNEQ